MTHVIFHVIQLKNGEISGDVMTIQMRLQYLSWPTVKVATGIIIMFLKGQFSS